MGTAAFSSAADFKGYIQTSTTNYAFGSDGIPDIRPDVYQYFCDKNNNSRIKDWASALVPYMSGGSDVAFDEADPDVTEAFMCPSDPSLEEEQSGWFIYNNIHGGASLNYRQPISYATNADITTYDDGRTPSPNTYYTWGGGAGINLSVKINSVKKYGAPLSGRLDSVNSPSSTAMMLEGGTSATGGLDVGFAANANHDSRCLMYTGSEYIGEGNGTLLDVYKTTWDAQKRIPLKEHGGDRHGDKVNVAFSDGHGATTSEGDWDTVYLNPHK